MRRPRLRLKLGTLLIVIVAFAVGMATQKALDRPPTRLTHREYLTLGIEASRASLWDEARRFFEEAMRLNPGDYRPPWGLADAAHHAKDYPACREHASHAIRLAEAGAIAGPDLAALLHMRAVASIRLAVEAASIPHAPDLASAAEHYDEATADLKRACRAYGAGKAEIRAKYLLSLAHAEMDAGSVQESLGDPEAAHAHYAEAKRILAEALEANPGNPAAKRLLDALQGRGQGADWRWPSLSLGN